MRQLGAILVGITLTSPSLRAINESVPYVREGLPWDMSTVGNYATIGQLEVGNGGNGIDGFDGHRHALLINYRNVIDFSDNDPADNNIHGTFVAGIMAAAVQIPGGIYPIGMAPLANYYGALFDGGDGKQAFLSLVNSLNYLAITSQVSAINNSWGGIPDTQSQLDGSTFSTSLLLDEYAGYHGKTNGTTGTYLDKLMVIAAGNEGETTGLLRTPADSYNGLVVGALDAGSTNGSGFYDPARVPLPRVASYSSWRPLANGRSGVDVVAPGTHLWSTLFINYFDQDGLVAGTADGTSFAAPHVTGEAALLYGAHEGVVMPGYTLIYGSDKGTPLSSDHKLIKAIIINSADKIPGRDADGNTQTAWQPGRVFISNGVQIADVPLNYAVGAGKANANEAYLQYFETGNRFWDLNILETNDMAGIFYTFGQGKFVSDDPSQTSLENLTATLTWDRHVDLTLNTDPADPTVFTVQLDALSDLDLILQAASDPDHWMDVFVSADKVGNVEHIYATNLTRNVRYRLVVNGVSLADPANGEEYALAVGFTSVPEPTVLVMVSISLLIFLLSRSPIRSIGQFKKCNPARDSQIRA